MRRGKSVLDQIDALGNLGSILEGLKQGLGNFLPHLFAALILMAAGILAAGITRFLGYRFLKNIGRFIPAATARDRLDPEKIERMAGISGKILYWMVFFFFLTAATETLGLPVVTTWLSGIALYLPRVLLSVFIVTAGFIGGAFLRDTINARALSAHIAYAPLLGRLTHVALVAVSVLIAVTQLGINIKLLTDVLLIVVVTFLLGAALAFGIGARTTVSNIIASSYVRKDHKVGDRIHVDGFEGEIKRITPTTVILESGEGTIFVPAKNFTESIVKKSSPRSRKRG